ncbi:recombinase family protein [Paraburkholderia bannensis]|uniref:recombinase family protein n=1 Tax=Paraburkholderia bannensis TaxID=765414 RepID=UPI002AC33695|nr:recombinase family protein [Paraburkholderia bannensis]
MNTRSSSQKTARASATPRHRVAPAPRTRSTRTPARVTFDGEPRVYSYIRFSSPSQADGTSIERQSEYAADWAVKNGYKLDDTLTLRDEGLSAYHQRHIERGALGTFLKAIEDGHVPPGSILIVESLDRLSRAEPIIAQNLLTSIVLAGIEVVTASDNTRYSRETVKANPGILFMALGSMLRANNESETKSDRIKRALKARCESFIAGTWKGKLGAGRDPFWIQWTKGVYRLNEDGMNVLRQALDLYYEGYGPTRIFEELLNRGLSIPDGFNQHNRLYKTFRNRALIGERRIEAMGTPYVLSNYYPAAVSVDEFERLQHMLAGRGRKSLAVKGTIPPLITGMKLCFCGRCDWAMVSQNQGSRRRDDGTYWDTGRRLFCGGTLGQDGCRDNISTSIVPIEHALLDYCSDQMNLDALRASDNGASLLAAKIAKSKAEQAKLEAQAERLADALAEGTSKFAAAKLREIESKMEAGEADLMALEREHATLSVTDISADADSWTAIVEGVHALDYDARMQARKLVANAFSKIAVFIGGVAGDEPQFVDLELVSRQGVYRYLRIDRTTGAWVQSHDFDLLASLPMGE